MQKFLEKVRKKAENPMDASPLLLAFLGDSVTHGCFEIVEKSAGRIDCIYDHEAVYHHRLKKKIETVFPNCPVGILNAGISGGNAQQGAQRVQRDVISAHPDLAIVCFGLNDAGGGDEGLPVYRDSLCSIFRQLREAEIATICMTPNMMCQYVSPQLSGDWVIRTAKSAANTQTGGVMDRYMQAAREVCRQERVTVCDCYADWKRLESLGADVTWLLSNYINHPTREMHELFAARLFETIFLNPRD